jgi:putative tryptophan/tyrosine transport system substrate-binding protein
MRRRDFINAIASSSITWSITARAQQLTMPVVALVGGGGGDMSTRYVAAFHKGLNETGTIEGRNAAVEYHWLEG